jgi:hypothetical protein
MAFDDRFATYKLVEGLAQDCGMLPPPAPPPAADEPPANCE